MPAFRLRITSFLLLLLGVQANVRAQKALSSDSSNLDQYADKILIKLNLSSQTDQYTMKRKTGTGLKLRANNEYKVFLSLDYEFIGFSYGFSPGLFNANNDDDLKGHTSFSNYKFQLFPGHWLVALSFDKTKGYYIDNTGDFVPGWKKEQDPYLQIPDLKNAQWAVAAFYVLNPGFSFKNLIYQTEWQKRSAGSLVPALFSDYNRYSFDFGGVTALQKDFNIRLGLGYYYTFIIAHRFYVAPNLLPSLGIRYSHFRSTDQSGTTMDKSVYFTRFLEGGIKIGYNSKRWVAGGGFTFNINWYNEDRTSVTENNKFYGILYLGYRLGTPKIIGDTYDVIRKKLP